MAAIRKGNFGCFLTNLSNYFNKNAYNFRRNQLRLFHCSSLFYGSGQEIKMPSLSPTMAEGKIVKWLKKEGDILNPGDVLCDIETDKAIISLEVEEEGILAKIVVPENTSNVKVGSLIAVTVLEGEDWKNVDIQLKKAEVSNMNCSSSSSSSSSSSFSSSSSSSSSSSLSSSEAVDNIERKCENGPSLSILINMPSLSPTMTAGTIIKWLKKEGDPVAVGDVLCDIQTDKAVMSLESEEEGILAKILVPDDSKDIKVGTLIAVLVPEGEDWKSVVVKESAAAKKQGISHQPSSGESGSAPDKRIKTFGPAVKAMLASYQLDPGLIKGSGKNNRLLKEDVIKYVEDNKLQRKPPKTVSGPGLSKAEPLRLSKSTPVNHSEYKDIELTNIRKVIAKRLVQSKVEIPHSYIAAKCEADNLIEAKNSLGREGVKVSVNDLLTKAVALALQIYPKANAVCINNEVQMSKNIDVCVAVATDSGLYTPIIKSTNLKSVMTISKEIKELSAKAKKKALKPEEFEGGTFTISNLGMFGITHFTAIINPPQCGIIAVGGAIQSLESDLNTKSHIMLNLSYDRRALEEQEAAEFMSTVKYVVENPKLIMLDVNQSALKIGL